ncbi:HIT family protein [Luteolibacter flavescens]|uniref:HIT family protein n=1 Tax=Luteolibacter flavescens TaxID=1859460 RepID=A0ABT3FRF5_9BACT|nr:HIT family protein [Luteolibacter flavescens]MCW1886164.1 HIT family protein [Luteolibacter flavescens]
MSFTLHPRLAAGSFELGELLGCRVLLKNNAIFPWILIVPQVEEGIEDLHELDPETYGDVVVVIREVSDFVASHFHPDKLNVACIGNQVRQMHIHVVGRTEDDPAWPGVVWSFEGKREYRASEVQSIRTAWEVFTDQ